MERKLENNWRFAAPTKSRRTFKLERLLGLSENRGVILFGGSLASLSEDRAVMVFNNPEDLERISVKIVEFNTNDGTIASTSVVDDFDWRFAQPRKIERTLKLDGFRGYLLTYSEHRAVMMFTSEPIKQDESFEKKERLDDDDDQENDQQEENQVKIDEPVSTEYSGESRTPVILSLFNLSPLQVRPQLPTAAYIPGQMVTDGVDMTEPIAEHVAQQMEESGRKNLVSVTKESLEIPKDGEDGGEAEDVLDIISFYKDVFTYVSHSHIIKLFTSAQLVLITPITIMTNVNEIT